MKKILTVLSCSVFFMLTLWSNASAENNGEWCSDVKVIEAGATSTAKAIYVMNQRTDCGPDWALNTGRWFVLDDSGSNANAMLAAVLTAQASGRTITIVGKDRLFTMWNELVHVTSSSN